MVVNFMTHVRYVKQRFTKHSELKNFTDVSVK